MAKADFDDAIADVKNAAFSRQGLKGLHSIRALLIDVTFGHELQEIITRSHNQPEERAAMVAALAEIKFALAISGPSGRSSIPRWDWLLSAGELRCQEAQFWRLQPKF